MKKDLVLPGIYQHYKGKLYKVIGIARHSETLEEMVVYWDDKDQLWIRPQSMFQESVIYEEKEVKRFVKI